MGKAKAWSDQSYVFLIGLIFFVVVAAFGWVKLQYGFCLMDEGLHMTESWRLTAGDHFLRDKLIDTNRLYTLINSLVFRASPNITLLGFRRLQYLLTLFSLLLFTIALSRVDGQYWYQPFVFSLFAFTGLDPNGAFSNLNYYTYPHLFLTLHLSFLLLGLFRDNIVAKRLLYVASGLCLWAISLAVLHLGVVVLSPVLLFIVARKSGLKSFSFTLKDLTYVLGPFVFCWLLFLGIYKKPYILSLLTSVGISVKTHGALIDANWDALEHIAITMFLLVIGIYVLKKVTFRKFIFISAIISILTYFIIDTSCFSLIRPYYRGWFSRPMWFSSLLISFFIIFLFNIVRKHFTDRPLNKGEELSITLLIPCVILSVIGSIFSTDGVLMVSYTAIPATAAIASMVLYNKTIQGKAYSVKALVLIIILLPFYYTTAWSDWRFTYFDLFPEQEDVTINEGFAKGIKTNSIYYDLYKWIRTNTERYTKKDDFMISYIISPMTYMISKRRPALDHSFTEFLEKPMEFYEKSIKKMKKMRRYPKIVFVFEGIPALFPVSLKEDKFFWFGKQFDFNTSQDPISRYVKQNMKLVSAFELCKGDVARCFVAGR